MKSNEKMILVMVAVLTLFLITITALIFTYYNPSDDYETWVAKEEIKEQEAAQTKLQAKIRRGEIRDRNGEVLALSVDIENKDGKVTGQERVYPKGDLFAHTVGYYRENVKDGSRYMLEKSYDDKLMLISEEDKEKAERQDYKGYVDGASLDLTLDYGMTEEAQELLEKHGIEKGSIVVMNPKTGEIYCIYSNPSFDPNPEILDKNISSLMADKNEPLRSRATSKYPPGSVYKIVTAMAALESGNDDFEYEDKVSDSVSNVYVPNWYSKPKVNGDMNLKSAIKYSSNVYFANLAKRIGVDDFLETAEKFFINKVLKTDITVTDATLLSNKNENGKLTAAELAESGFGQGVAMMTPLHMAMVASTVANDGILVKPYIVSKVTLSNGEDVPLENKEKVVVTRKSVRNIKDGMIQCVHSDGGTAHSYMKNILPQGLQVAGKTGTAQNLINGKEMPDHTWFIGFAPAYDPQIALCVMGENTGGGGGGTCGPIAAKMIKYCYENGFIEK